MKPSAKVLKLTVDRRRAEVLCSALALLRTLSDGRTADALLRALPDDKARDMFTALGAMLAGAERFGEPGSFNKLQETWALVDELFEVLSSWVEAKK